MNKNYTTESGRRAKCTLLIPMDNLQQQKTNNEKDIAIGRKLTCMFFVVAVKRLLASLSAAFETCPTAYRSDCVILMI